MIKYRRKDQEEFHLVMDGVDSLIKETGYKAFDARIMVNPNTFKQILQILVCKDVTQRLELYKPEMIREMDTAVITSMLNDINSGFRIPEKHDQFLFSFEEGKTHAALRLHRILSEEECQYYSDYRAERFSQMMKEASKGSKVEKLPEAPWEKKEKLEMKYDTAMRVV